jgi:hypothetical protein
MSSTVAISNKPQLALEMQPEFSLDRQVHVGRHLAECRVTMLGGHSPHDTGLLGVGLTERYILRPRF